MPADLETCAECGAPAGDGGDCWARLMEILSWEWTDPELQALHFVTVASYNLQHPARFEPAAIASLKTSLRKYLAGGLTIAEIRRTASAAYDGKTKVLRDPAVQEIVLRRWPVTVADVYRGGVAEGAAGRVHEWASAILAECESPAR